MFSILQCLQMYSSSLIRNRNIKVTAIERLNYKEILNFLLLANFCPISNPAEGSELLYKNHIIKVKLTV